QVEIELVFERPALRDDLEVLRQAAAYWHHRKDGELVDPVADAKLVGRAEAWQSRLCHRLPKPCNQEGERKARPIRRIDAQESVEQERGGSVIIGLAGNLGD